MVEGAAVTLVQLGVGFCSLAEKSQISRVLWSDWFAERDMVEPESMTFPDLVYFLIRKSSVTRVTPVNDGTFVSVCC